MNNNEKLVSEVIKKSDVAFISSVDKNGFPNTKAMLKPRIIESTKYFYFTTNTSSMRVEQYLKNKKACIYFYHKKLWDFKGVMLLGEMEVLTDQKIKNEMWKTGDNIYYPKGVTDPDYCILKFTASNARYYSNLNTFSFDIE